MLSGICNYTEECPGEIHLKSDIFLSLLSIAFGSMCETAVLRQQFPIDFPCLKHFTVGSLMHAGCLHFSTSCRAERGHTE